MRAALGAGGAGVTAPAAGCARGQIIPGCIWDGTEGFHRNSVPCHIWFSNVREELLFVGGKALLGFPGGRCACTLRHRKVVLSCRSLWACCV